MTNSISYALTLCDDEGNLIKGSLEYSLIDGKDIATEKSTVDTAATSQSTTEVGTFQVKGSIKLPEVTGEASVDVNGVAYVSMMGPPIATMLTAQIGMKLLSMEFNFIESNGAHIGGGLSWASEPMQPAKAWGIIGKKS